MPSSYTNNLGIELPADGELDAIWGDVVNDNMGILDRAINGTVTLTLSGTSSTLTTSDGTLSDGQYKLLVLAGSPSGTHTITIAPNDAQKIYFVRNTTAQSVVFTQGSGGDVTIATGDSGVLYADGAGAGAAVANLTDHFAMSSVKITGGSIDGAAIGGSSAAAGSFTTGSFSGDLTIADKIVHSGDTNTAIRFPAADTVTVETAGAERVRVDSSGNVGIGTTSPSAKLMSQVNTFTDADKVAVKAYNAQGVGAYASFQNSATGTAFTDGFRIGIDDSENAVLQNLEATNMIFGTNTTERMRIDSSGNLLVGTTTNTNTAKINAVQTVANGYTITAEALSNGGTYYLMGFKTSDTIRGSITSNGTSTTYSTSSDYRLKENVEPMQNALDVVAQLNPVTYTWKADGSSGQGFIAHELQAVVPDCVTGEKDAVDADGNPQYQGVDTSFLVGILTKAIQEQQATITALTARIEALENK